MDSKKFNSLFILAIFVLGNQALFAGTAGAGDELNPKILSPKCQKEYQNLKKSYGKVIQPHKDYKEKIERRDKARESYGKAIDVLVKTLETKIKKVIATKDFKKRAADIEQMPKPESQLGAILERLDGHLIADYLAVPFNSFVLGDLMDVQSEDFKIPGLRTSLKTFYLWIGNEPGIWGITLSRVLYPAGAIAGMSAKTSCSARHGTNPAHSGWNYKVCGNPVNLKREYAGKINGVEVFAYLKHTSDGIEVKTDDLPIKIDPDELPALPPAPSSPNPPWGEFLLGHFSEDCKKSYHGETFKMNPDAWLDQICPHLLASARLEYKKLVEQSPKAREDKDYYKYLAEALSKDCVGYIEKTNYHILPFNLNGGQTVDDAAKEFLKAAEEAGKRAPPQQPAEAKPSQEKPQ